VKTGRARDGPGLTYLYLVRLVFPTHVIKLARGKKGSYHFRGLGTGEAEGA